MKPLRSYLLATASSVALIGSAAAQPPAPPIMSWAGPYVGLNLGVAWNRATFSDLGGTGGAFFAFPPGTGDPFWSPSGAGFTFGGQAGYNWQSGNIVYGVESDLNWADAKTSGAFGAPGVFPINSITKMDWMGTVRGRLGVAYSQFLFYGTGGIAFAHFEDNWGTPAAGGGPQFTSNSTRTGWTAGGGVEYMLARNWTVRAEALYAGFGSKTITVESPPIGFLGNYSSTFRHSVAIARGALNWKW